MGTVSENSQLYHHGILGQKWGIRRYQPYPDGHNGGKEIGDAARKSSTTVQKKPDKESSQQKIKELTDDELRQKIQRLELEKRYADLSKTPESKKVDKGKAFIADVMEKSGKNIATQLVTYGMGTAVNKIFNAEIVNPKKGQKDK